MRNVLSSHHHASSQTCSPIPLNREKLPEPLKEVCSSCLLLEESAAGIVRPTFNLVHNVAFAKENRFDLELAMQLIKVSYCN